MLLNCLNGTVDLRPPCTLRAHRSEDFIRKLAPTVYTPGARFEPFDRFLADVLGDGELAAFVQTAFGYSATGDTREDKLFVVHGPGASGKSTLLEAYKAALGDYAKTADIETFLRKKGDSGPRNDLADLAGCRFVLSIEVEEGKHLAEAVVKSLTGGDTIKARHLYAHLFEFRPQFKLWLACNDKPRVRDSDTGLWRRIVVIPFEREIPAEKRDRTLKPLLREDLAARSAILAWAVEGCLRWQREGLRVPRAAEEATSAYREEMDALRQFLADCCTLWPGREDVVTAVTAVRGAYDAWCKENGEHHVLKPQEFNACLERKKCKRTVRKIEGKDTKVWTGISLEASEPQPVETSFSESSSTRVREGKIGENPVSTGCGVWCDVRALADYDPTTELAKVMPATSPSPAGPDDMEPGGGHGS